MPLIIPKTLPAYDALYEENVFVMHRERALAQHSKLAPAASAEASGEYAATYFATYIDGVKKMEIEIGRASCRERV